MLISELPLVNHLLFAADCIEVDRLLNRNFPKQSP